MNGRLANLILACLIALNVSALWLKTVVAAPGLSVAYPQPDSSDSPVAPMLPLPGVEVLPPHLPHHSPGKFVAVLIELVDAPAVHTFVETTARASAAEATAATRAQLQQIEAVQRDLLSTAPLTDALVIYQTQRVFNGIAAYVKPESLTQLATLPGVRSVYPLPTYSIDLVRTVPFVGAPVLWNAVQERGLDGSSVTIGIIDTGIDYLHRTFGGSGAGYDSNDLTRIDDLSAYPNLKVVGGYDFAGDNYNANSIEYTLPEPDPDPMDCWGHGTHVAGIAAGYGTLINGSTYSGPYHTELDFTQFSIGPGVAPQAQLYALKVFGCSGTSQIVAQAIEWAVDPNQDGDFSDRLDVLNLSLGSAFGAIGDPTVIAVENASLAGVVVVAAAGNSGGTYYITSSPGVATRAISVGASSSVALPNPRADDTVVDALASFSARGPRRGDALLKPDLSAPGVGIVSAAALSGSGRQANSGTSMAAPHVAGAAALLRQLHPDWDPEEIKALLINTARYDLLKSESYPPVAYGLTRAGAGRLDLAGASRATLLAYTADNSGAVSLSFGAPSIADELTLVQNARLVNKSDQPRKVYLHYVPVVDLPGADVQILGSSQRELSAHGSANVAVALSANASTMRNVADPTAPQRNNLPRHRLTEESGFVYIWPQRLHAQATLLPLDVSMRGVINSFADLSLTPASNVLSYSIAISSAFPISVSTVALRYGSAYSAGPVLHALLDQPRDGVTNLTLEGSVVLSTTEMIQLAAGAVYLSMQLVGPAPLEARGQLELMDTVLRLPVYAAPRPAAFMRSASSSLSIGDAQAAVRSLSMVGDGLLQAGSMVQSEFPTDTVSIVSALELQYSSINEESSQATLDHADLRYVGIGQGPSARGDFPLDTPVSARRIVFGLVTYGEWSTPNEVTFQIHIDTDEDGFAEFVLSTTNLGTYLGSGSTDEFITVLQTNNGAKRITYFVNLISAAELNMALFNNNVLLLAVDAQALGLNDDNSDFRYRVSTYSRDAVDTGGPIDFSPLLRYDVAQPGLLLGGDALGDFPVFYDLPGTKMTVYVDREAFQRSTAQGMLLLHHHNVAGHRAEVVEILHNWTSYLPTLQKQQ